MRLMSPRESPMRELRIPIAFCIATLATTTPISAKTLVYCSEGSPENFYPAINTTGTTFDASGRQLYNRLVEFTRGTTKVEPGLAQSYDVSAEGTIFTFHLCHGVKWHTTKT